MAGKPRKQRECDRKARRGVVSDNKAGKVEYDGRNRDLQIPWDTKNPNKHGDLDELLGNVPWNLQK